MATNVVASSGVCGDASPCGDDIRKVPATPWYVVLSKPRQERVAMDNLVRQGYSVYLPWLKQLKRIRGERRFVLEPMFPRYLFVQPESVAQSISPVRSTLGVSCLVKFGLSLAVLRTETLEFLRSVERSQHEADRDVLTPFKPGVHVRVVDGVLSGITGLVSCSKDERVVVLMRLMGVDTRVTLADCQLEIDR